MFQPRTVVDEIKDAVQGSVPFVREQATDLTGEIIRQLDSDAVLPELFEVNEEPAPRKVSGVEAWFAPKTEVKAPWMKVGLELKGCLVRQVKAKMAFPSGRGFATTLSTDPTPGWVLEQAILTRKHTELAKHAIAATSLIQLQAPKDLLKLAQCVQMCLVHLTIARNSLLLPNPLSFPRTLRPFNGFSPPLGRNFVLDFALNNDNLVVSAFHIAHSSLDKQPTQAVYPDFWYHSRLRKEGTSPFVGLTTNFQGVTAAKVLEHHQVVFQVAALQKVLVLLDDTHRMVQELGQNLAACFAVRPVVSMGDFSVIVQDEPDEHESFEELVQPTMRML